MTRRFLCIHCERVNVFNHAITFGDCCIFCRAAYMDLFPWREIARKNGYPLEAKHGDHYALYGERA